MLKGNFISWGMVFIMTVHSTDDPLLPCTCPHSTTQQGCLLCDFWSLKHPVCTFLHHLNVTPFIFNYCFASFEGASEDRLFSPSYKTGREEVFTLLYLYFSVRVCSLEVTENTNVKKFYYDVLFLFHRVPLVDNIPLFIHKLVWK